MFLLNACRAFLDVEGWPVLVALASARIEDDANEDAMVVGEQEMRSLDVRPTPLGGGSVSQSHVIAVKMSIDDSHSSFERFLKGSLIRRPCSTTSRQYSC